MAGMSNYKRIFNIFIMTRIVSYFTILPATILSRSSRGSLATRARASTPRKLALIGKGHLSYTFLFLFLRFSKNKKKNILFPFRAQFVLVFGRALRHPPGSVRLGLLRARLDASSPIALKGRVNLLPLFELIIYGRSGNILAIVATAAAEEPRVCVILVAQGDQSKRIVPSGCCFCSRCCARRLALAVAILSKYCSKFINSTGCRLVPLSLE